MKKILCAFVALIVPFLAYAAEPSFRVVKEYDDWKLLCRESDAKKECVVLQSLVAEVDPALWIQLVWRKSERGIVLQLVLPRPARKLRLASDTAFGGLVLHLGHNMHVVNFVEEMCHEQVCEIPINRSPTQLMNLIGDGEFKLLIPSPKEAGMGYGMEISTRGLVEASDALAAE